MQEYLKKNFWLVNVATVIVCAIFVGSSMSHLLEAKLFSDAPSGPAPAAASSTDRDPPAKPRSKSGEALATRNMFCSTCEPPKPAETPTGPMVDSDTPPLTGLPLRLIATSVAASPANSYATIHNTSSSIVGAYYGGPEADHIPDAGKIIRIAGGYVDFENEQSRRVERLSLTSTAARPSVASSIDRTPPRDRGGPRDELSAALDEGIRKTGEFSYEVDRSLVQKLMSNPTAIRGARIVPAIKDGKPNGFKLYAIRPSSPFAKIGLQNGDTIHSINGFDLTSPDKALEVYTKLREANNLSVSVTRRGKPVEMDYSIR